MIGLVNSVLLFSYELVLQGDLVYYTNGGGIPGPPLPSILMTFTVIACGVVVSGGPGGPGCWWARSSC